MSSRHAEPRDSCPYLVNGSVVSMRVKGGPGRPHKGDRPQRTVRVPRNVNTLIERDAEALGLTMSDFLANIVMAHYGLPPVASPTKRPGEEQQELRLKAS